MPTGITPTLNNNYLGTYTFSSLAAFEAGTPLLYTRSIGDPTLRLLPRADWRVLPGRHPGQEGADAQPRRALQLSDARGRLRGIRAARGHHVGAVARAARPRCARAAGSSTAGWTPASGGRRCDSTVNASARRHHHQSVVSRSRNRRRRAAGEHVPARRLQAQQELCDTAPASISGSRRAPASTSSTTTTIRISCRAATNLNPLIDGVRPDPGVRQHHRDGDRRGAHPARAVRQLQSQSSRPVRRRATGRSSTGAGLRPTAAIPSFAHGGTRSVRSTCRPAARWTPSGVTDLPTTRTAST